MAEGYYLDTRCKDEQQAISYLKDFLTGPVKWYLLDDITNTSTDRDIVLKSPGEVDEVANSFPRFIRLRGTSNNIYLYTYEEYTNISTNSGEVSDSSFGLLAVGASPFRLRVVADRERVVIYYETPAGTKSHGYVGRINSYYTQKQHRYPNLVKGGGQDWYHSATAQNSWMRAPSGSQQHYFCIQPAGSTTIEAGYNSYRDGSHFFSAPVLVNNNGGADNELAGEPRGVYRAPAALMESLFIKINYQIYTIFETITAIPMAVGPITASGIYVIPDGTLV